MCFRPAETGALPVLCPSCGKKIRPAQGQIPKNCPFYKSSLEGAVAVEPPGEAPVVKAPSAPKASGPMVPSAPQPSKTSEAPKTS